MIVVGLMSGTSMDGVDGAAVEIVRRSRRLEIAVIARRHVPYPKKLRVRLETVADADGTAEEVCLLDVEVGRLFGRTARQIMDQIPRRSAVVASHGQTVRHRPDRGATLQIGNPAVIAQMTGAPVWSDFRSADMAAGGEGAPLAPVAHLPLFAHKTKNVAVVNLGGIANITHVPTGAVELSALAAYDIGPAMRLIDLAARAAGIGAFDRNGAVARKGGVDADALRRGLAHPYYRKRPPKSTGRELFDERYLADAGIDLARADADTVATLTELTARVVADEMGRLAKRGRPTDRLILCGGGAKNGFLRERIARLSGVETMTSEEAVGVPVDAVECLLMALLGYYAETGVSLDLSSITGAATGSLHHGARTPAPKDA